MTELQDVIETLDNAADSFESIATKEQKKIYDEVLTLTKDLETDASGKVKQSIQNLKRLTLIKAKLAALSKDKEWAAGISHFLDYFGILQKKQNEYYSSHFPEATLSAKAKEKNELMRQMAVQNTIDALMGDGLKANVTDKLNDILLRAVTSGAKFADLQEELRAHLLGKDGGQGAFARYANTYATTAISQYTGQHNKLMTQDLDTDWFVYEGSNKETTREFCEHLTAKRFIHKSEIPTILTGKIDDYQCAIYPKTGLPYGMIEGTTPDNFQCNCGGWNCRHQLVPVAGTLVPLALRQKFAKLLTEKPEKKQQETQKQPIPAVLKPFEAQMAALEQYVAQWPKSAKVKDHIAKIYKEAQSGNADDLGILVKAAMLDMKKFAASKKAQAKAKDAQKAEKEFMDALNPYMASYNVLEHYLTEHNSGVIQGHVNEIKELIQTHDKDNIPAIQAIIDIATQKVKKYEAAAKVHKDGGSKKKKSADDILNNDAVIDAPNKEKFNKKFTQEEIDEAEQAVKDTIDKWLKKYGYANWASAPASHKKAKLEWEINHLSVNKPYKTWEIAKNAYQKLLDQADADEKAINVTTLINELKAYKSKSVKFKIALKEAEQHLKAGNIEKAIISANEANKIKTDEETANLQIKASKNENKTKQKNHIYSQMSTNERIDAIMTAAGVDRKTAKDYNDAVYGFSFQWDYEIREVQCGRKVVSRHGHTTEDILKKAQDIENFLSKSPKWSGVTLYRGMSLSPKELEDMKQKLIAGTADMQGGSSWSTDNSVSEIFAGYHIGEKSPRFGDTKDKYVVLECSNMKNATSIKHLSRFYNEDEVYSSMGNRFSGYKESKSGRYIYLEVKCI